MWLQIIIIGLVLFLLYRRVNKPKPTKERENKRTPSNTKGLVEGNVCKFDDLKNGEMKEFPLGDGNVLVVKTRDEVYAVGNKCSHYGAPLKNGALCGERLRCPWHGACFNVKTGDIEDFPGCDSIPVFDVKVVDGQVNVRAQASLIKISKQTRPMKERDPSDNDVILIVGGGVAGLTCAETLRQEEQGFGGRIVILNREPHYAYDRPKLSKNLGVSMESVRLRKEEFFKNNGIEVKNGVEVNSIDFERKVVTTSEGEEIKYQKCLLATGADPNRLKFIPGHDANNIYPLRTIEEANAINKIIDGKHVAIVGSSFIGMETASVIYKKAESVTVIGMETVPFERVLGKEIGSVMQKWHETLAKIRFQTEAVVSEFVKNEANEVVSLKLKVGPKDNFNIVDIPCDIVILGSGVLPATSYLDGGKIKVTEREGAVVVDEYLNSSQDGVYAAGDLARFNSPWKFLPNESVRIEHWGYAQVQGKIAAKNMIHGNKFKCDNIPFFWTTQYGKKVTYVGHALKYQRVIVDTSGTAINYENPKFVAYYINNGVVAATCAMNKDTLTAQIAEILNAGFEIKEESLDEVINSTQSSDALIKDILEGLNK